jgi:hypothetical protein
MDTPAVQPAKELAQASTLLNRNCFCITLDQEALCRALEREAGDPEFCRDHMRTRPNLFSNVPVFLPKSSITEMQGIVAAIHSISEMPAYQTRVLTWAPDIARKDFGPSGALMGYDFHLADDGARLIEVNTNAGGAFLNALLAKAQLACCAEMENAPNLPNAGNFNTDLVEIFEEEWRLQSLGRPLLRIAIVDDAPQSQYLYPEFVLARETLLKAGYDAFIAGPNEVQFENGQLTFEGKPIDLVYDRLVDFAFELPEHATLRSAYESGMVAVTPNPRNHALLADKRNLILLSDPVELEAMGVSAHARKALQHVPRTVLVTPESAEETWRQRKRLFFKPARGHGSKAVYRGDKVTRGVFEGIVRGDYVAQEFAAPGERMMRVDGVYTARKVDVRLYAYKDRTLLVAARLYQGQATNFRTPGGGFAPVLAID